MSKIQETKLKKKDKTHSTFSVTIPSIIIKMRRLKKGDEVNFLEENGRIFLEFEKK